MVKSMSKSKSKKLSMGLNDTIGEPGTRGGNHGRLDLPRVTRGGARIFKSKPKSMVRSGTRITGKSKSMVRSGTRIRPGITSGGGRSKKLRKSRKSKSKSMVRSGTRIRPGITA